MKRLYKTVGDLNPKNLTMLSFSGAITKTYGILPLDVIFRIKFRITIMMNFTLGIIFRIYFYNKNSF